MQYKIYLRKRCSKMKVVKVNNGYYIFKLDDILKNNNVSMSKLLRDTETDFYTFQRIKTGNITRIDLSILSRLCDYFDCDITDIIEYKKEVN